MPKSGEKPANRLREVTALLDSPEISALFDKVRTAVEPPPPEVAPTEPPLASKKGGIRLATPAIAVLVLCVWCCYGGARSPWMRLTLPGGAHSANVVAGDTSLYNGDFFANESLTALRQLDLFKGTREESEGSGRSRGSARRLRRFEQSFHRGVEFALRPSRYSTWSCLHFVHGW